MSFLKRWSKEEKTVISKKTILLISHDLEDNSFFLEEIRRYGVFDVVVASSGKEGIRQSRRLRPDIIFVDWDIEQPSAPEVIYQIRRIKRTQDVPLCLILHGNRRIDAELVQSAGIKDYIMKPFSVEKLVELIQLRTVQ